MAKRKAIPQSTRFEVFKRDSFRCQYCGRSAPDVVLNLDHVVPVSKGGDNDIMNLVTSCVECNGGKGAVMLDDNSVIEKQKKMLAELQEKQTQLQMMIERRNGLRGMDDQKLAMFNAELTAKMGCALNDLGAREFRMQLKKYSIIELLDALDTSINQYYDQRLTKDKLTQNRSKVIDYAYRIAKNKKNGTSDAAYHAAYVNGILRNRGMLDGELKYGAVSTLVPFVVALGFVEVSRLAKECDTSEDFMYMVRKETESKNV